MFVDNASTSLAAGLWEETWPRTWLPVAGVVDAVPISNPAAVIWVAALVFVCPTRLGTFSFLGPWSLGSSATTRAYLTNDGGK